MPKLTVGETVRIVDPRSEYYEQTGVIEEVTKRGSICVLHKDQKLLFYPWGLERFPELLSCSDDEMSWNEEGKD
jgi:hypothetical protein